MIAILQRVTSASVEIDGECTAQMKRGLLILLGVGREDCEDDADALIGKITKMRIFPDENGRMNLSVSDIGGEVIVVPNFTLYASYKKGNRPDFMNSAAPSEAEPLFDYFCGKISEYLPTGRGVFGADMKVSLLNDGPVTIPMDSRVLRGRPSERE